MSFELYLVCAFLLTSFVAVFYQAFKHLTALIQDVEIGFKQSNGNQLNLDEIKEELLDLIQDVIGNMEPPRAVDHVFGAIAQILQFKAMKLMNVEPADLLQPPDELQETV